MTSENVWDYPRPPRVESFPGRVRVLAGGQTLADTTRSLRVLETSHPPAFYIPPEDVALQWLNPSARRTLCEFKGTAHYWDLMLPDAAVRESVAWSYQEPTGLYARLAYYIAFYPGRVDECWVDEERVTPQEGDFYGGWITSNLLGPFAPAIRNR